MLVDNEQTLTNIFSKVEMLIATHCEDEATIRANSEKYKAQFGDDLPIKYHPIIRDAEACYKSSSLAVGLAKKHGAQLHVLHISSEKELALFDNSIPLEQKRITAEACIHHMWFDDSDYETKGTLIKWNPAVKAATDREAILQAVIDNRIDVVATDHAPHTWEEKQNNYWNAPSGGPLAQHALLAMLQFVKEDKITIEHVVRKMAHNPAILFNIVDRGFIREGYYADLVLVDPTKDLTVEKKNILYKCGWSPFEGTTFNNAVDTTIVSGNIVYQNEKIVEAGSGQRLLFNR
jgi:dihydroorotase